MWNQGVNMGSQRAFPQFAMHWNPKRERQLFDILLCHKLSNSWAIQGEINWLFRIFQLICLFWNITHWPKTHCFMETEINFLFSNEHRTIPSFKAAATMQHCESLKQSCCQKYLSSDSSLAEEEKLWWPPKSRTNVQFVNLSLPQKLKVTFSSQQNDKK